MVPQLEEKKRLIEIYMKKSDTLGNNKMLVEICKRFLGVIVPISCIWW
jgi:hypothetical protein